MANTANKGYRIPDSKTRIIIEEANLFDQDGLKIVHCPRQFETHSDVICHHSLIDQLVCKSREAQADIDKQIDDWCRQNAKDGHVDQRLPRRQVVFKFGKLCPIVIGSEHFYLAAFNYSSSQQDLKPLNVQDYIAFWNNIWANLQQLGNTPRTINVPIPGGVHVDFMNRHFDINQKIGIIVSSFFQFFKSTGRDYTLRICLYGDDVMDVEIDHWYEAILPYLYHMSFLNIQMAVPKEVEEQNNQSLNEDAEAKYTCDDTRFLSHLHEIIQRLCNANKMTMDQNTGNAHFKITVELPTQELGDLEQVLHDHPILLQYFSKVDKDNTYNPNKMIQLLSFVEKYTTLFGNLNRKNYVSIIRDANYSATAKPVGYEWIEQKDEVNFGKYIGQQIKNIPDSVKDQLLGLIPEAYHRKQ